MQMARNSAIHYNINYGTSYARTSVWQIKQQSEKKTEKTTDKQHVMVELFVKWHNCMLIHTESHTGW